MIAMTILPTRFLPKYGRLNGAHFCLAHLALKDRAYAEYYWNLDPQKTFITVDNSAWELGGEPMPVGRVMTAANVLHAHEIWLPDVLYDGEATVENITRAVHPSQIPDGCTFRLAAAPQGQTWTEWLKCYAQIARLERVRTIGIPKHLANKHPGGRIGAISELIERKVLPLPGKKYHMLGVNDMTEVESIGKLWGHLSWCRSIDTAAPVHLAWHDTSFFGQVPARCGQFFELDPASLNGTQIAMQDRLTLYMKRYRAAAMERGFVW